MTVNHMFLPVIIIIIIIINYLPVVQVDHHSASWLTDPGIVRAVNINNNIQIIIILITLSL